MAGEADGVAWLTYDELAARLGIGGPSARNLARRRRWGRRPGNDGLARVGVPLAILEARAPAPEGAIVPPVMPPTVAAIVAPIAPPAEPDLVVVVARLEVELVGLKQLLEAERGRAEAEARRAEELRQDRDRWHAQAERLVALPPPPVITPAPGILSRLRRALVA